MSRFGSWRQDALSAALVALWVAFGLLLAYRVPQPLQVDLGSSYAQAYTRGFDKRETNQDYTYAFTGEHGQIFVAGAGGGNFATTVQFDGTRPEAVEPARVFLGNDRAGVTFLPPSTMRSYHVLLPSTAGDIDYRIATNPFRAGVNDPRILGVPIDRFAARPLAFVPPLRAGLVLLALALALYALARRLAFRPGPSALLALLIVSSLLYGLVNARMLITVGLVRWLVVLAGLHLLLWPLRAATGFLYRKSNIDLATGEEIWLARIVAAATLVKLGGILYPHIIIFDEPAHVMRMQWVLDGRFLELYRPGYTSYMGDTVGLGSGQFPYSPLWYLVVVPFRFIGLSLNDATNGLSALMDVSKLIPIHMIVRATIGSRRAALMAAAFYHLLPMPLFLLSWGNYPTQFGLWASLLATAFLVVNYRRFEGRRMFFAWVAFMMLAILSYTVLGVFAVSLFGLIALLGLMQRDGLGFRRMRFIIGGMIVAELFCFALYHVQFASAFVRDTLPAIVSGTSSRLDAPLDASAEARMNAAANIAANNQFTVNHFTSLGLLLSAAGFLVLALDPRARRWWPVWGAWIGLFVLYTLVSAYVADMVLKHVFYVMPLIAIALGLICDRWWGRGRFGQAAVVLVMLFFAAQYLERGHFYLLVKRHFV
jgi:hypothetical protein